MSSVPLWWRVAAIAIAIWASASTVRAHSGPPFPIVSDRVIGGYEVSLWTDPDVTDDRTPQGKFWVTLRPSRHSAPDPGAANVTVAINPLDRAGVEQSGRAEVVNGNTQQYFIALLMDHEGPFGVHVDIDGPLGKARVDASTDATYDLRPRPILMVLFLFPFLVVGFVWGKLLLKRRRGR